MSTPGVVHNQSRNLSRGRGLPVEARFSPMTRMADILPWPAAQTSDAVVRHLAAGRLVALPTEAGYVAACSALSPSAVARLPMDAAPAVMVGSYPELYDWLPRLSRAAARVMRKTRGEITLQAEAGFRAGLWSRLPDDVRDFLARGNFLAVRRSTHTTWQGLRTGGLPVIAISLSAPSAQDITNVDVVVDAGPADGQSPSVVRADRNRLTLHQEGAVSPQRLDELALVRILFICTGNTCRSPMAAALCTKLLAERIGCSPAELKNHGFLVQSAGISAMMDSEASPEAVTTVAELGGELSQHRSNRITLETLLAADHIFAMTAGHWYTLKSIRIPDLVEPKLLSPRHDDVADPIGGPIGDYRACADQILGYLQERLPELLES